MFLLTGAVIYTIETYISHEPLKNALSAVAILIGGYRVIVDWITNRDVKREIEDLRRQAEADAREKADLRRQAEADARENAELRRRIAELEQRGNGAK